MREAILHSLEYFNTKLRRHKLRMDANIYSLVENTGADNASNEIPTSKIFSTNFLVLHPSQNLFETKIHNL